MKQEECIRKSASPCRCC